MLASNIKPEQVTEECYGSIKLEGVRGIVRPHDGLVTRNLKPFGNSLIYQTQLVQKLEEYCAGSGITLEGEFYVHGWTFNRIDSCLRGEGNIDVHSLQFHVFDCYIDHKPDLTFKDRVTEYTKAVRELKAEGCGQVEIVVQYLMMDEHDIRKAYCYAIENGYEGFCLKKADAPYKLGRSTTKQQIFVRIKPEETYDCVVLDILERQQNLCESEVNELGYLYKRQDKGQKAATGLAQSAVVYTPALGKVHKVSLTRGLTDPDRARIWEERERWIGTPMQFVAIPVPGQEVPRSPRFDKWRGDIQPTFLEHPESDSVMVSWDPAEVEAVLQKSTCHVITLEQFIQLYNEGYSVAN
ncbi:MAG: putative DNA ligase [Prokaryotic dsDNA virus sp.]|nr:MAG: putative DNA ligase [Prokaryotic dsDNA virus sp.]